jgi:hypothetical protein
MQTLIKGNKFEKATEGELYTLPDFIKQVDAKTISPELGNITEVIVDGFKTNIAVNGWTWYGPEEQANLFHMPLQGLTILGKFGLDKIQIQIVWVPKKKVEDSKESPKI